MGGSRAKALGGAATVLIMLMAEAIWILFDLNTLMM
jgi:hypothetical protein